MKKARLISGLFTLFMLISMWGYSELLPGKNPDTIIVTPGFERGTASPAWLEALKTRMPPKMIDSISQVRKEITVDEKKWKKLIESKTGAWESFRDSLAVPFRSVHLNDTIYIRTGYGGAL